MRFTILASAIILSMAMGNPIGLWYGGILQLIVMIGALIILLAVDIAEIDYKYNGRKKID